MPIPSWPEPFAAVVDRDMILVEGADAAAYLQGQCSQDVVAMDVGQVAWSLLLEPQGKVNTWFRVTRVRPDQFELDIDAGFGVDALHRLERFKLRTKVDFELTTHPMVSVRAGTVEGGRDLGWGHFRGTDLLGDTTVPDGVRVAEPIELEAWRIVAGMPKMGAELIEKTIPAEIPHLVEESVSFTKGCYVGQELVARIDSRGASTPRKVCRLFTPAVVSPGDPVHAGGDQVGTVTSAAEVLGGSVALASIVRSADPEGPFELGGSPASALAESSA